MSKPDSSIRFNRFLFMVGLASLPYLFYGSMVGIFVVLVNLVRRFRRPCLDSLTMGCVIGLASLMVLSSAFAYNRGEAFLHLSHFLPYLVLFAFLPGLLRGVEVLEKLAIALVLTAIPINLIAAVEFVIKSPLWPQGLQSWPIVADLRQAPHRGRAMVMFDHPNVMASYLVLILGLGLGLLLAEQVRDWAPPMLRKRPSIHHRYQWQGLLPLPASMTQIKWLVQANHRAMAWFARPSVRIGAVSLNLVGIFCSGSRNGLAIAISQLLVFAAVTRFSRKVLGAIGLVLLALTLAILGVGLGVRPTAIFNVADDPRLGIWTIAAELMQERPWLGWGLGNFKFLYPPRLIDPNYQDIFHPHNIWLLLGSEAGIVVMVLMTLMVAFICYRAVFHAVLSPRSGVQRAIAIGYLLAFWGCVGFALFDVTFYDVRVNATNWSILAALYAISYGGREPAGTDFETEIVSTASEAETPNP